MRAAAVPALGAILFIASCGRGEGSPTAAPSSTSMPSVTPTSTATPAPDAIDGVEVVPLQFGEEAEIPDDVALIIETGCIQCDGPTTGLVRLYRDPPGQVRTDTLFSP